MAKRQKSQFRLMTYNIGGARRDFGSALPDVIKVISEESPDILVVQEATEFQDADGIWHSALARIAEAGEFENHVHFGPTLSMREHMHVGKTRFVQGIFNDWQDWKQGNAILSRAEFVRLGDPSTPGLPRNVPLYVTPLYQGNRDTDPRYALLARVDVAPIFPFVVGVHLTTLVAERGSHPFPGRAEEAEILRFKQTRRLLDLLKEHVLAPGEVVFLLGDFNAVASEPCISLVLETEGRFVRLIPSNGEIATHPKMAEPIDHILVYPPSRLVEYQCWIIDNPIARQASDHLPVVADVEVS
jgi:endonuclease/exonuclease/phosphatase family metal-dependent hydrolase